MNIILVTSNKPRHLYFVNEISRLVDVNAVFLIKKENANSTFDDIENKFFSEHKEIKQKNLKTFEFEDGKSFLNSKHLIEEVYPDIGFVFGAPLLPEDIIKIPNKGFINIHTGLVQYHRGVDSSYWAIYEDRPETIGVTVHYIDKTIDGGDIISQRQNHMMSHDDTPDDIFLKNCIVGVSLLSEEINNILYCGRKSVNIEKKGKLYQKKDMNHDIMDRIRRKAPKVLEEYLNGDNTRSLQSTSR